MTSKPILKIDDLQNGGNQKALDAISAGVDEKKLKKLVRHIKGLDLKYTNFEYLKTMLMPFLNGYFIGSATTDTDSHIYRAVSWAERPENIKHLSYPPANRVSLGRANNHRSPIFYGSAGCHSTIMELRPNQGERVAISKWRIKQNLNLICIGYTENAFKHKVGMQRLGEIQWVKQYDADPLSNKQGNQFVNEFLAREFMKHVPSEKSWQYKISAAISELGLNAMSFGINGAPAIEIAGILYPSVPNEANADNVALKCSIVDNYLEFISAQYVEISKKTLKPEYTIQGLDFADSLSDAGEIQRRGSFPSDLIAGTDHSIKYGNECVEIVDNKNIVIGKIDHTMCES